MSQPNSKRDLAPSEVRLVVEVDGHPVGILNLDLTRLWPLIDHRKRDHLAVDWIEPTKFDSILRAAVLKRLMARLEAHMYKTLGDEMVKAELDVETITLKAEAAAQAFGRTTADIEKLAIESDRSPLDFYAFIWDYLLDEGEVTDLKKEWKAWGTRPR
jgi:hypothetical protein